MLGVTFLPQQAICFLVYSVKASAEFLGDYEGPSLDMLIARRVTDQ